jgi:hypothetical protein
MAVTLEAPRAFYHSRYPLVEDLDPRELPEAFSFLSADELPPEFTAYNQPFMIDEEDIDFGKEFKLPGTKDDEHELGPGLLPPAEVEELDEEFPASDFDHNFDNGVGKEFDGDFAPEEDDEYDLESSDDEDLEAIPDKLAEIEEAADDVVPPADDEEVIPDDIEIDD